MSLTVRKPVGEDWEVDDRPDPCDRIWTYKAHGRRVIEEVCVNFYIIRTAWNLEITVKTFVSIDAKPCENS